MTLSPRLKIAQVRGDLDATRAGNAHLHRRVSTDKKTAAGGGNEPRGATAPQRGQEFNDWGRERSLAGVIIQLKNRDD